MRAIDPEAFEQVTRWNAEAAGRRHLSQFTLAVANFRIRFYLDLR
jgi:hypothetical protein